MTPQIALYIVACMGALATGIFTMMDLRRMNNYPALISAAVVFIVLIIVLIRGLFIILPKF